MNRRTETPRARPRRHPAPRKKIAFSPAHHVPAYSRLLFDTLRNPLVVYMIIVGNLILLSCCTIFYFFEHPVNPHVANFFDALWWGMSTVTTVGYGDIAPVTWEGRVISMALMVTGIVFFVGWTALVMSFLFRRASEEIVESEALSIAEYESVVIALGQISDQIEKLSARLRRLEAAAGRDGPAARTLKTAPRKSR